MIGLVCATSGLNGSSSWVDLIFTTPNIKIIMITAHDSPQDRSRAYNNGADFFLSKPFTFTEVNNIIDVLLSHTGD